MTGSSWIRGIRLGVTVIAVAASAPLAALATTPIATTPPPPAPAKAAAPKTPTHSPAAPLDPSAVAALVRMSAYLRGVQAFQVRMATQKDDVDIYGQLITLNGETTYKVRSRDAFSIHVSEPAKIRQYVYDGNSLVVYDFRTGFYTRFHAPPTIRQTLDLAADAYRVTLPLDDLFNWDQGDAKTNKLTSAHYIGPVTLSGQAADHYAYRQPGVDWQIWIARGDKPVPLRVVIVSTTDPARPQFQGDLTWDTSPRFAAGDFDFRPPANARAIPIRSYAR
jgi:hypothetical protein